MNARDLRHRPTALVAGLVVAALAGACTPHETRSAGTVASDAGPLPLGPPPAGSPRAGYYRYPTIHDDTILFTSEGDLWEVGTSGGAARRLTTGAGVEAYASTSPDGKTVAYSASYEGPKDVYTMPIGGGVPARLTWDGEDPGVAPGGDDVAGWTPDGRVLVRTRRYATLPGSMLVAFDLHGNREIVPLAQASQGAYTPDGKTLFFTRLAKQGSQTKRYEGGTAENLWRYDEGKEAVPLTGDTPRTSRNPMVWGGRVYFLSDRDGVMNVYSMKEDGHDVRAETHHGGLDVQYASLSAGRIVYQLGADLWLKDLASGKDAIVPITIVSDFDQLRDHWVKDPMDYLTAVHIAPDGGGVVVTARGEVFTVPAKKLRIVKVAANPSVRYRDAVYQPDGKSIALISTETGETEFWSFPANGVGKPEQWTKGAKVLRQGGVVSPDGRWLAHWNKDLELWLFDIVSKKDALVARSQRGGFDDLVWSPDGRWLAYSEEAANGFRWLKVLDAYKGDIHALTSDRYNSGSPTWSTDGKWIYFLSDRVLQTTVHSPWGPRQPDPSFDRGVRIYALALLPDLRSPFTPPDELHPGHEGKEKDGKKDKDEKDEKKKAVNVRIDFEKLGERLREVPVSPRNYEDLQATDKRLCWIERDPELPPKRALACVDIDSKAEAAEESARKGESPYVVMKGVKGFEVSENRKKLLVHKEDELFIIDADATSKSLSDAKALAETKVDFGGWSMVTDPRAEMRQFFLDAWRLERDYFYDRGMHGVDWPAIRDRYAPLLDRVSDRRELDDVIAQMVSELSALHTFVGAGDARRGADKVKLGALGARLRRDPSEGGFVVEHVYEHDPDQPEWAPPLARPDSRVEDGEVIVSIDGQAAVDAPDERALLRGKAGRQVLLHVTKRPHEERDVIVVPITAAEEAEVRYRAWEYTRRQKVDADSHGRIGYVHLQAMGAHDIEQWAREFYPVFDRQGLIVDVRHNRGGNIDSWLLAKLQRKAWFYWQPRVGEPHWNMQYAFRGHMVVLCDGNTGSDGEAFTEGFRRLGLGKVIGTRTWGGEIWLSAQNHLADRGIATAAETGVYGPEGAWLIEGHGVDPDIVQDNLPHATFSGEDAQLDRAISQLTDLIEKDPRPVPKAPPYPNKAFAYTE